MLAAELGRPYSSVSISVRSVHFGSGDILVFLAWTESGGDGRAAKKSMSSPSLLVWGKNNNKWLERGVLASARAS